IGADWDVWADADLSVLPVFAVAERGMAKAAATRVASRSLRCMVPPCGTPGREGATVWQRGAGSRSEESPGGSCLPAERTTSDGRLPYHRTMSARMTYRACDLCEAGMTLERA